MELTLHEQFSIGVLRAFAGDHPLNITKSNAADAYSVFERQQVEIERLKLEVNDLKYEVEKQIAKNDRLNNHLVLMQLDPGFRKMLDSYHDLQHGVAQATPAKPSREELKRQLVEAIREAEVAGNGDRIKAQASQAGKRAIALADKILRIADGTRDGFKPVVGVKIPGHSYDGIITFSIDKIWYGAVSLWNWHSSVSWSDITSPPELADAWREAHQPSAPEDASLRADQVAEWLGIPEATAQSLLNANRQAAEQVAERLRYAIGRVEPSAPEQAEPVRIKYGTRALVLDAEGKLVKVPAIRVNANNAPTIPEVTVTGNVMTAADLSAEFNRYVAADLRGVFNRTERGELVPERSIEADAPEQAAHVDQIKERMESNPLGYWGVETDEQALKLAQAVVQEASAEAATNPLLMSWTYSRDEWFDTILQESSVIADIVYVVLADGTVIQVEKSTSGKFSEEDEFVVVCGTVVDPAEWERIKGRRVRTYQRGASEQEQEAMTNGLHRHLHRRRIEREQAKREREEQVIALAARLHEATGEIAAANTAIFEAQQRKSSAIVRKCEIQKELDALVKSQQQQPAPASDSQAKPEPPVWSGLIPVRDDQGTITHYAIDDHDW